jgi:hypothetical protein
VVRLGLKLVKLPFVGSNFQTVMLGCFYVGLQLSHLRVDMSDSLTEDNYMALAHFDTAAEYLHTLAERTRTLVEYFDRTVGHLDTMLVHLEN